MKKNLSRIFSLTLIVATVASPAMAQTAKRVKTQSSVPSPTTMTIKDVKTLATGRNAKSDLHILPVREAYNGLDKAKKGKIKRVAKAPAAPSSDIPNFKGLIGYNFNIGGQEASVGYYEIAKSDTDESNFLFATNGGSYGVVAIDGILYTMRYANYGSYELNYMYVYDIETGEELNCVNVDGVTNLCPAGMVVDPTTGDVYGIGYDEFFDALQLSKLTLTPESCDVTTIGALDGNWNSIVCDAQGQLYGISYVYDEDEFEVIQSYLNKIDKTTAAVTQIGETGLCPEYGSSACIDPTTGRMFWNVCFWDETACIAEVDLQTGEATILYELVLGDEIYGLTVPAPAAADNAPNECENFAVTFSGFGLSGNATVLTPATYYGGGIPSGTCTIHVLANDVEVGTLTGADYGTEVTVPVTVESAGSYTFKVYASNETGDGPKTSLFNVWVGPDTPEATKASLAYVNGNMEVSWNEVTESVNGGSLPAVTYTVKRYDGTVAAEGLTTTAFTETVAEPEELTYYYYEVYVVVDDLVSDAARTNSVTLGSIALPYTTDFRANGLADWTVLDVNGDGKTWSVYGDDVRYSYSSDNNADDWLISPPVKLEKGKAYLVSFSAHNYNARNPERLEVKYGTQPTEAGMTKTLVPPTVLEGAKTVYEFSEYIIPDETGTYYVGFHAISDADKYYIYVSNVTIESGVSDGAPDAVTDIVITPDASGAPKANVAFNAPIKTQGGNDLSNITKIEVLNGSDVLYTFNSATPGAAMSCDVTVPEKGQYEFTIIAYNKIGEGVKATGSVYVGFDLPEAPETVTIARTATEGEVSLSWDAVTKDIHGLAYPSGVTYNIYERNGSSTNLISTVSGTTYTYQAVAAGQQNNIQCIVAAVYDGERGSATYSDMIPIGTPYTDYYMTFVGGALQYALMYNSAATEHGNGGATLSVAKGTTFSDMTGVDGKEDGFIYSMSGSAGGSLYFELGLINTADLAYPGVSFYTYNILNSNGTADANEIYIYARKAGETEWTQIFGNTVADICGEGNNDWGKANALLDGFENSVVEIRFEIVAKTYSYTMIDNIKVGSTFSNDLVVKGIQAPSKVKTGADYLVDVTIANGGALTADSYNVELYADGNLVDTKTETNLAVNGNAVVSFERTMSAIATEPVTYMAKVVFSDDQNVENNQSDNVTVIPVVSTLPTPTGLSASSNGQRVVLTWNEPNFEGFSEEVTDDFEDANAFANKYGDWIFVDMDDSVVGGFSNMEVPGIAGGTTKDSFWIWDASQVGNQSFAAHSGNKYLFALFRADSGTTNDWAISPELLGDAQTIRFYAKSYSSSYPEKIKVMYSNGSTDLADFTAVEGYAAGVEVPGTWTLYQATLPAGAKRFAINSCATDSFMLMVDDVTYTPAGNADLQLKGYNVYRDGVKINPELVEDATYTDTNVEDGKQYKYVVTAVYEEKGESAASNEVEVNSNTGVNGISDGAISIYAEDGNIVVLNAEGLQVTVASVDGAVVFDGVGEAVKKIDVAYGVYVVKAGNVVRKLQVK